MITKYDTLLESYRAEYIRTPLHIPNFGELPTGEYRSAYYSSGDNELETWLRNVYHPQIAKVNRKNRRSIQGYTRMFVLNVEDFPSRFEEPKCYMDDVYKLCQVFTYRLFKERRILSDMGRLYQSARKPDFDSEDARKLIENASGLLDAAMLAKYKSMPNVAYALTKFITVNLPV